MARHRVGDAPPHVLLPRPIGATGGNMPHGQNAGYLGKKSGRGFYSYEK